MAIRPNSRRSMVGQAAGLPAALSFLVTAVLVGCASTESVNSLSQNAPSPTIAGSAARQSGSKTLSAAVSKNRQQSSRSPAFVHSELDKSSANGDFSNKAKKAGVATTFSTAFRRATSAVSDAFIIAPEVTPASDATSLSSMPKKVGPGLYVAAARVLENQGKFDRAEEQYKKALKVDENNLIALLSYARLHDRQANLVRATQLYQKAVSAHPNEAKAFNDLGLCYARRGMIKPSIDALTKAVSLQPSRQLYRNNLARRLVAADRVREAHTHLLVAFGEGRAHYNLGFFLYERNDTSRAIEHFTKALQFDPSLIQAQDMLVRLGGRSQPPLSQRNAAPGSASTSRYIYGSNASAGYLTSSSPSSRLSGDQGSDTASEPPTPDDMNNYSHSGESRPDFLPSTGLTN